MERVRMQRRKRRGWRLAGFWGRCVDANDLRLAVGAGARLRGECACVRGIVWDDGAGAWRSARLN